MALTAAMSTAMAFLATVLIVMVLRSLVWRRRKMKLPPGPRGWPVLGNLGLLAGSLPPHRALAALAARHGTLMHLRLGSFHVVVASTAATARLVLKTHDQALADRPPTAAGAVMSYGYRGILHTPYGAYWRMARKLCATELFSMRRVEQFEHVRELETRALVRGVFARAGLEVEVKAHVTRATMRNVLRMAVGDKWSGSEAFMASLDEAFEVSSAVNSVGEWVPWLGWLDVQGLLRRMRRVHAVFDRFYEQILDEHEAEGGGHGSRDLVDVLLHRVADGEGEEEELLTRDGVKCMIQDIIAGGTETTAATIEWALAELLRHPDAMAAATAELDRVVGRDRRWVAERDLPELPYVDAVVKETMRLHPVGPLLAPHYARERAVVGGYELPAGTRVLVNVWAVACDPASWPDAPAEFRPTRFLPGGAAHGVDVRGKHFELLPFGAGRRMCPAYGLAMKEVVGTLANLLLGFAWRLPDGVAPVDLSMEESFGLSLRRKVPLVAVAEPRLPPHLYTADD